MQAPRRMRSPPEQIIVKMSTGFRAGRETRTSFSPLSLFERRRTKTRKCKELLGSATKEESSPTLSTFWFPKLIRRAPVPWKRRTGPLLQKWERKFQFLRDWNWIPRTFWWIRKTEILIQELIIVAHCFSLCYWPYFFLLLFGYSISMMSSLAWVSLVI